MKRGKSPASGKSGNHVPSSDGIDHVLRQVEQEFSKTVFDKFDWIAAVGPHWQFGIREEEEVET
jgi:hypothetical protein